MNKIVTNKATRMKTPYLSKMVEEDLVTERLKHDEKHLGDDWVNTEKEMCPKCEGFGKNPAFPEDPYCHACDGSGIWYILTYGVEDKKPFAYTDEYGVDFVKECCKADREAFADRRLSRKHLKTYGIMPYRLTKTLEMEFISRGYEPHEIKAGRFVKQIANIVAKEYPQFLVCALHQILNKGVMIWQF